ncbi:MAG: PBP1A family penicillin-binding protein [Alphaproteobacteria bacterium]|nr:PBP1A family penicillin-binding protein [Alphaproteobacteria bacterium]MCL2757951.1 PBP1A family penicillin-binding protein [Alphaproteobacteria bacterium]
MAKKEEKKSISLKWRLFGLMLTFGLVGAAAVSVYVLVAFLQMPSLDSMLRETRLPTITFVDRDGFEIRSANRIMGTPVSMDTLPPHVWQAIIAIEDKRFFEHNAIDFRGLTRSMVANIRARRVVEGGSTITQQTAKNIFLTRSRTVKRKVQELILAFWLENRFTKNQILELYMNRVSLVRGMRGIDVAARELFQKPATELTIAESAQIAAMLKAPTTFSPVRHPERNIARARVILVEMVRQEFITIYQAREAATQLFAVTPPADTNVFRYWTNFVMDEVTSRLGENIESDLIVWTTLDSDLHERAANVMRRRIMDARDRDVGNGAVLAMSRDGALRVMVGGIDYQVSQFNRTTAMRQPGSTFKPVVYLVALEAGLTPSTMVHDAPFAIGDYNPRNFNERYYGDITLAVAFNRSVNSVPLRLTERYGLANVLRMAGRLGIGARLKREYSTVLGASEMTLLDLTTMYNVIWNDGVSVRPYAIERITTPQGQTVFRRDVDKPQKLLQPQTVAYMTAMLAEAVRPGSTGARARTQNTIGGKTGTSNDFRDAWFVGATNDLTLGVWVGNDNFTPMDRVTGGTVPAEIFRDIVQ